MLAGRLRWIALKEAEVTGSMAKEGQEGRVSGPCQLLCSAVLGQADPGWIKRYLVDVHTLLRSQTLNRRDEG